MKRHAPATRRNAGPIAEVLARELPAAGLVLEVASGTGEHAVFMARRFPALAWQPSDRDIEALASIDAYAADAGLTNLLPALIFDAAKGEPPVAQADALVCINMVHISPWEATVGLIRAAAALLENGAPLVLYGPYIEADVETALSNVEFDRSLRERDAEWGLRNVAAMDRLAAQCGLARSRRVSMPSNNLVLVYRKNSGELCSNVFLCVGSEFNEGRASLAPCPLGHFLSLSLRCSQCCGSATPAKAAHQLGNSVLLPCFLVTALFLSGCVSVEARSHAPA